MPIAWHLQNINLPLEYGLIAAVDSFLLLRRFIYNVLWQEILVKENIWLACWAS